MAEDDERNEEASDNRRNDRESVAAAASLDKLTDHVIFTPSPRRPLNPVSRSVVRSMHINFEHFGYSGNVFICVNSIHRLTQLHRGQLVYALQ
jgi:hypothetical protein